MRKEPLPIEELNQLLRYEPETGLLFWKPRTEGMTITGKHVSGGLSLAKFNAQFADTVAGHRDARGYIFLRFHSRLIGAHRIAFAIYHGVWSNEDIDHINGKPFDNRIDNLRAVSHRINMRNTCLRSDNKTGIVGVCWDRSRGRWMTTAKDLSGKHQNLGRYICIGKAIMARKIAERSLQYHRNHGRPA